MTIDVNYMICLILPIKKELAGIIQEMTRVSRNYSRDEIMNKNLAKGCD